MGGPEPPKYDFREEDSFAAAKARMGVDPEMLDERIWTIQDTIVNDPFEEPWSVALPSNRRLRVAVSDPTEQSAFAIRIIFCVEGNLIRLLHVEER